MIDDDTPPKTWNSMLAEIRKRPAMFFGTKSLQAFEQFVRAFAAAEQIYAIPDERRRQMADFDWDAFQSYVAVHYNPRRLSLLSFGLAQLEAQGKDLKSFEQGREYPGAWEIWWGWHDEYVDSQRDLAAQ